MKLSECRMGVIVQLDNKVGMMPKGVSWEKRSIVAHDQCLKELEDGWEVSTYFGSKDSFFEKDGVQYCKGNAYTYI